MLWSVDKKIGEKKKIGAAITRGNCDVDADLPRVEADAPLPPRASDWVLAILSLGAAAILAFAKLRSRFERLT